MIRYGITVIENSLMTAMLTALIFAAVWKEGEPRRKKILVLGSALGCAAALIFAVLRRTTAINIGIVNVWVLSLVLVSGVVFIVPFRRGDGASRLGRFSLSSAALAGALLLYTLPPLFLLPSEFVLAGQSVFSTEFLVNLAGAVMGLGLVVLAGYALYCLAVQGGESLPPGPSPLPGLPLPPSTGGAAPRNAPRRGVYTPRTPQIILSALLLVNGVNYTAELVRFLMARRIIPLWRTLFKLIMAMVNNQKVFLFLGIGIAALLPLALLIRPLLVKSRGSAGTRRTRP